MPEWGRHGVENGGTVSYAARLRERISTYSVATAVLLGVFALLLIIELATNRQSRLDFAVTLALILGIAAAGAVCLFLGDRAGPWPALLLVFSHVALAILFLTVLNAPLSAVGVMLQMPVLALYLGAFLTPWLARTAQAVVLVSFGATTLWDPSGTLDDVYNGRNLPNLSIFTWLCLEAGIFVQKRFRKTNHIDELTGLHNRRGLIDRADLERARADRSGQTLVVAVADLDLFKELNDGQGHEAGDEVLRELARDWKAGLRETDFVARVGGDEFVFLLPDTDLVGARQLFERLSASTVHPWSWGAVEWHSGDMLSIPIAGADEEMYRDKAVRRAYRAT